MVGSPATSLPPGKVQPAEAVRQSVLEGYALRARGYPPLSASVTCHSVQLPTEACCFCTDCSSTDTFTSKIPSRCLSDTISSACAVTLEGSCGSQPVNDATNTSVRSFTAAFMSRDSVPLFWSTRV